MSAPGLRGAVAVAGIGETVGGHHPERSSVQLHAEVAVAAARDAGVPLPEVDCFITANSRVQPFLYHAEMVAEYLGITPAHCLTLNTGGSTSAAVLQYAAGMLLTGQSRYVLIAKADNLATGMGRTATIESMATIGHPQYESPAGPLIPALYALFAARYMYETGVKAEHVALAAVVDRQWAALNPAAQYRSPLTVDDVLGSKLIADPLHLLDCAPISDAGAAMLVTTTERARDLQQPSVSLLGIGETHDFEHVSQAPDLGRTGAVSSGETAFAMAGVARSDIDVAMVYDAFGFIQLMQLEDLGFCDRGQGGELIASGATAPGGSLPTNTHGGVLSHSHAGKASSLFQLTEAVAQLRGDCGDRQVEDAQLALVHTEGGILASHCTAILGRDR